MATKPKHKGQRPQDAAMVPVTAKIPRAVFEKLEAYRDGLSEMAGVEISTAAATRSALVQWAAKR
jgi:hypothetical protein